MNLVYKNDLSFKQGFKHLENLNVTRYMSFKEFGQHEWTRIILSHIHEDMFWVGEIPIMIKNDMIHKLTIIINEYSNPMNVKNVKRLVETNLKSVSNGRNMKLDKVEEIDVKLINKIIRCKMNYSFRVNSIPIELINTTYIMTTRREKVNMCEILRQHLVEILMFLLL